MENTLPYICPVNGDELILDKDFYRSSNNKRYKIKNNIPRFCSEDNYTESFGFQWNKFDNTQIDSFSNSDLSHQRFWAETNWDPKSLDNLNVLEIGSGAGRFSEIFLNSTKGNLYSIDYSTAVEANLRNNKKFKSRLILSQASIYQIPFKNNSFDKIFCFGVLQHTPSFRKSISALVSKVKVNGEIVIDFYPYKGFYTKLHSKYILRPITKRISKKFLLFLIKKSVPLSLIIFDTLIKLKLGFLSRFLPITDVRGFPKKLNNKQRIEWAIMDTFDAFSPEFDNPQRLNKVIQMFEEDGCKVTFGGLVKFKGGSAVVVRAFKKTLN
jgi:ubiquinone/menaquinone biosynthesis C-methylase UbiE